MCRLSSVHTYVHKQFHLLLLFPVACDGTDTLPHLINIKTLSDIFSRDGGFRVRG